MLVKNYDIYVISLISPGLGQSQAKPGQLFGFWPGLGFYKARTRPKPGLSGQAGAGTSLFVIYILIFVSVLSHGNTSPEHLFCIIYMDLAIYTNLLTFPSTTTIIIYNNIFFSSSSSSSLDSSSFSWESSVNSEPIKQINNITKCWFKFWNFWFRVDTI